MAITFSRPSSFSQAASPVARTTDPASVRSRNAKRDRVITRVVPHARKKESAPFVTPHLGPLDSARPRFKQLPMMVKKARLLRFEAIDCFRQVERPSIENNLGK